MNQIVSAIRIDLKRPGENEVIHAVQGEHNARRVEVELLCNGDPWYIPENAVLRVRYGRVDMTGGCYDTLPDGTLACSWTANTVSVTLVPAMMAVSGMVYVQLELHHNGGILCTFSFRLLVAANPAVGTMETEDYINMQKWLEQKLDAYIEKVKESGELLGGTMTGPIDMNGQVLRGLKMPIQSSEASTKGYTDLAVKRATVRNLLDNSDFRNPVNQRCFVESYDDCMCIDRWKMSVSSQQGDVSAVRLLDGYLELNVGKGELDFEQTIPNHDELAGKRCTVAINVNGFVHVQPFTFNNQSGPLYFGNTQIKFYSVPGRSVIFRLTSDTDIRYNLYWVALYEGEYTLDTLPEYKPKGYGTELLECMRYYYRNWSGAMSSAAIASIYCPLNGRTTSVVFSVPMRVTPTVTVYNPVTGHSGCVADWSTDEDIYAAVAYSNEHHFIMGGNMAGGQMVAYNYEASADL